jgi:Tol biopolymer transport system component
VSLSPNDSYAVSGVLETDTFTADLWGLDLAGGRPSKLNLSGVNGSVVWMPPDGERMLYVNYPSLTVAASSLRTMATDGSVAPTTIAEFDSLAVYPTSISPDAAVLIGSARSTPGRGAADVWVLALDELIRRDTPETEPDITYLLRTEYNESHATFSPDGRWIAYASDEAGASQIYVIPYPYPGPGSKRPVSTDGGRQPRWNPAGGELFYLNGTRMMSVTFESSGGFRADSPEVLFDNPALLESGSANSQAFQYDVTSDGQAFLLLSSAADSAEPPQLRVIVNWSEELSR